MTMKSLGLDQARQDPTRRRIARTEQEYAALGALRESYQALRLAFAQSKIFDSSGDGNAPFANCTLARLQHILNTTGSTGGASNFLGQIVSR